MNRSAGASNERESDVHVHVPILIHVVSKSVCV